jgi:hypothetical protein
MGPVVYDKLGKNVLDVTLNRFLGERQFSSDLFISISLGDQSQDVYLARSQDIISRAIVRCAAEAETQNSKKSDACRILHQMHTLVSSFL